jgi:hypothetical protein
MFFRLLDMPLFPQTRLRRAIVCPLVLAPLLAVGGDGGDQRAFVAGFLALALMSVALWLEGHDRPEATQEASPRLARVVVEGLGAGVVLAVAGTAYTVAHASGPFWSTA